LFIDIGPVLFKGRDAGHERVPEHARVDRLAEGRKRVLGNSRILLPVEVQIAANSSPLIIRKRRIVAEHHLAHYRCQWHPYPVSRPSSGRTDQGLRRSPAPRAGSASAQAALPASRARKVQRTRTHRSKKNQGNTRHQFDYGTVDLAPM
jgi:hypothetical protein